MCRHFFAPVYKRSTIAIPIRIIQRHHRKLIGFEHGAAPQAQIRVELVVVSLSLSEIPFSILDSHSMC